jgi:glyoxylase-like metal-dependent hydrolase (beta-lactamase superfamily II)
VSRQPAAGTSAAGPNAAEPVPDRHAWERPGLYEVDPGVYRIPLPLPNDGLRAVNAYAIMDGDEAVLVDPGWALPESERRLAAALGQLGLDLGSITRSLVTHVHRDHYTQAVAIRKRFGTRVGLGAGEAATINLLVDEVQILPRGIRDRLSRAGAGDLLAALATAPVTEPVSPDDWARPDDWLRTGMVVKVGGRSLQVIETPGHTLGHVVFHDPGAGLLFAGDHVLPHITPSIGFEAVPPQSPLALYLASLRLVAALADSRLLPAHGPVLPSTRRRTAELVAHHDRRLMQTEQAVRAGHATGYEVAGALRWTSRERGFADLDGFNQMIAVNETLAHLDVLVEQHRIGSRNDNGVTLYHA